MSRIIHDDKNYILGEITINDITGKNKSIYVKKFKLLINDEKRGRIKVIRHMYNVNKYHEVNYTCQYRKDKVNVNDRL